MEASDAYAILEYPLPVVFHTTEDDHNFPQGVAEADLCPTQE